MNCGHFSFLGSSVTEADNLAVEKRFTLFFPPRNFPLISRWMLTASHAARWKSRPSNGKHQKVHRNLHSPHLQISISPFLSLSLPHSPSLSLLADVCVPATALQWHMRRLYSTFTTPAVMLWCVCEIAHKHPFTDTEKKFSERWGVDQSRVLEINSLSSVAYVKQLLPCDPLKRGHFLKRPSELQNIQLWNQELWDFQNAGHQVRFWLDWIRLIDLLQTS